MTRKCLLAAVTLLALGVTAEGVAPLGRVVLFGADTPRGKPVALSAHNELGLPMRVKRAVTVERWHGKGWREVARVLLRAACRPDPKTRVLTPKALAEGCLTIAPRKTFGARPWLGTVGDAQVGNAQVGNAQCACERCRPAQPGKYRYVGRMCDGKKRIYSPVFRIGAGGDKR